MNTRVAVIDNGYAIIVDDERIASVVREETGWAVRDVKSSKRYSKGSRQTAVSARAAFYGYFGNNRSYKPWVSPLAAQLPADPIEARPVAAPTPEVTLAELTAQAEYAEARADAALLKLKGLFARLGA